MLRKWARFMVYKLNDPAFLENPADQLARMRAEGPLVRMKIPLLGTMWATTTDEATRKLLKSPDLFRRDPGPITGRSLAQKFWWLPRVIKPMLHTMIVTDDPAHARQRRLVEIAFARTSIEDMRPRIEAIAHRLLDALPQTGPVDIVAHYTRQLPFLAICELLGIPESAHAALTRRIAPLSAVSNPITAVYAMARLGGVQRDFHAMFARARAEPPGPGLISALVHTDDNGAKLSEEELLSLTLLLFLAGHETTVHLINAGIVALAGDAALTRHFINTPDTRHLFVEEIMRSTTPVTLTKPMFAAQDTDVLGANIRKGEMVAALLIAANHDPDRVDAPQELRPERRPNAHLGFGFGPHVCLGMQLARVEAVTALTALFARHPDLRLARPPGWLNRAGFRAPGRVVLDLRR
ncbi:cytochrome P450 [Jannaschia sp. CCS1]|uniref:cytochrome P450 n=1 Tax=Jannaschia sp. (strain CCS1) TaxID=290400 RepID=UPI00006C0064|nr:cytochrome P450 [Jannaschia sp. CCS1]ABD55587.1 cytochrome P450 [Jannaschia sp. CCS1]